MMEGSINRRGGLRWDSFSTIKIDLPSLEEQNAIASVLVKADKEIELAKEKLSYFQSQKRGLMQQLLTGKKRIMQL
jgi:type I restriction enzyme S subunit